MPQPAAAQDEVAAFYKGRTITLVVGASSGGGLDLFGRLVARHIGQHIPGNPGIVVTNQPGAGSVVAAVNLYTLAPKDGTQMAIVLPGAFTQQLFNPTIGGGRQTFDPAKFTFIGNGNAESPICVMRTDSPVKTFADVFNHEIAMGTPGGGSTVHEHTVVTRQVLGAKFKVVTGYPGTREIVLAAQRGEVQGICGFSLATTKLLLPGSLDGSQGFKIVVQNGIASHPELKQAGVPLAIGFAKSDDDRRLLELFYTLGKFSRAFIMPPGVPQDRASAIRAAFIAAIRSAPFQAEADKMHAEAEPQTGAELEAMIAKIYATPRNLIDRVHAAMK